MMASPDNSGEHEVSEPKRVKLDSLVQSASPGCTSPELSLPLDPGPSFHGREPIPSSSGHEPIHGAEVFVC